MKSTNEFVKTSLGKELTGVFKSIISPRGLLGKLITANKSESSKTRKNKYEKVRFYSLSNFCQIKIIR